MRSWHVAPEPRANPRLVGHDAALRRFETARSNGRLAHAWLIEGPEGIGKATLVYALARRLLAKPEEADRVDDPESPIFRQVAHGVHPDLWTLKREIDPKTKRLRKEIIVEQVRDQIIAMLTTSAWNGLRVLIVDCADELNLNAANALLKFLEEPPEDIVILLVNHAPMRILPTIRSRCVRLSLKPPAPDLMTKLLSDLAPGIDPAGAADLLDLAGGSPGRALRLMESGAPEAFRLVARTLSGPLSPAEKSVAALSPLEALYNQGGIALALAALARLVRRRALTGAGLDAPDDDAAARLAPEVPLDRWLALWDNLARLPGRVEALTLDPKQAMLLAAQAVATGDPALVAGLAD